MNHHGKLGRLLAQTKDVRSLHCDNAGKRWRDENRFKIYLGSYIGRVWYWIECGDGGEERKIGHPPSYLQLGRVGRRNCH